MRLPACSRIARQMLTLSASTRSSSRGGPAALTAFSEEVREDSSPQASLVSVESACTPAPILSTAGRSCKSTTKTAANEQRRAAKEAPPCRREFELPVPAGYDFSMAICSYGFFCMMPNQWTPPQVATKGNAGAPRDGDEGASEAHGVFRRPLRYGWQAGRCCTAQVTCEEPSCLRVTLEGNLPANDAEQAEVVSQVSRMCRLDSTAFRGPSVEQFWRLHPEAKARAFGYLFRSPTVWEDMVKTITLCNVRWKQSLLMNRLLCNVASSVPGSFPSPWDIVRFEVAELQQLCSLGYRAGRVRGAELSLAAAIVDGTLDLAFFDRGETETPSCIPRPLEAFKGEESPANKRRRRLRAAAPGHPQRDTAYSRVRQKLLSIDGFGKFAADTMLQLLGFFEVDAFDSETARHMSQVHKFVSKDKARVWEEARRRYEPYRPFQFLAYWFELWKMYEKQTGMQSKFWTSENSFFVEGAKGP